MTTAIRCPRCRGEIIRQGDEVSCFACGWAGFPPIEAIRAQEDLIQSETRRASRGPRHGNQQI